MWRRAAVRAVRSGSSSLSSSRRKALGAATAACSPPPPHPSTSYQQEVEDWARPGQLRQLFGLAGRFAPPGGGGELRKVHHEKRLLPYTPEQLFDVVADVSHYEQYVPWCQRSRVLRKRSPESLEAELEVGFKFFVERYVSLVTLKRPEMVKATSIESNLFHHLINKWEFSPGPRPGTSWLTFTVDFQFKSQLYAQAANLFFSEVVQRMVRSFEERCDKVYKTNKVSQRVA
eukprot:jgi/Chlat1/1568/Chrsp123S01835